MTREIHTPSMELLTRVLGLHPREVSLRQDVSMFGGVPIYVDVNLPPNVFSLTDDDGKVTWYMIGYGTGEVRPITPGSKSLPVPRRWWQFWRRSSA